VRKIVLLLCERTHSWRLVGLVEHARKCLYSQIILFTDETKFDIINLKLTSYNVVFFFLTTSSLFWCSSQFFLLQIRDQQIERMVWWAKPVVRKYWNNSFLFFIFILAFESSWNFYGFSSSKLKRIIFQFTWWAYVPASCGSHVNWNKEKIEKRRNKTEKIIEMCHFFKKNDLIHFDTCKNVASIKWGRCVLRWRVTFYCEFKGKNKQESKIGRVTHSNFKSSRYITMPFIGFKHETFRLQVKIQKNDLKV